MSEWLFFHARMECQMLSHNFSTVSLCLKAQSTKQILKSWISLINHTVNYWIHWFIISYWHWIHPSLLKKKKKPHQICILKKKKVRSICTSEIIDHLHAYLVFVVTCLSSALVPFLSNVIFISPCGVGLNFISTLLPPGCGLSLHCGCVRALYGCYFINRPI